MAKETKVQTSEQVAATFQDPQTVEPAPVQAPQTVDPSLFNFLIPGAIEYQRKKQQTDLKQILPLEPAYIQAAIDETNIICEMAGPSTK